MSARMTEGQLQAHLKAKPQLIKGSHTDVRSCEAKAVRKAFVKSRITHIIGIDPGKYTGFAVYNRAKRVIDRVDTIDFWQAYKEIGAFDAGAIRVVIEVSENLHIWNDDKRATNKKTLMKTAANVGGVRMQGQLLAEGLRRKGYTVTEKHPQGKVSADEFRRYTGYQGRTNEHNRDAGMLAFKG